MKIGHDSKRLEVLEIRGWVEPSRNEWDRTHWAEKRHAFDSLLWRVIAAYRKRRRFDRPARISIVYYRSGVLPDHDNVAPKMLMDALKRRVIMDDSPNWAGAPTWEVRRARNRREVRTVVIVTEA